jgi:hypothetical protein
MFPGASLRDWKSYADYLVLFAVADDDLDDGVLRQTYLRVDRALWGAPGAPRLPRRIELRPAWAFKLGDTFLSPLLHDGHGWRPPTLCAPMLIEHGVAVVPVGAEGERLPQQLAGMTVDEIARAFQRQPPDALAARFSDLRPPARVEAVLEARGVRAP